MSGTAIYSHWAKECSLIPAKVIASCFALVGFAIAALIGLAVGNTFTTVLGRATIIMLICWAVGRIVGGVLQRTVVDHIEKYKKDHPIPGAINEAFMDADGAGESGQGHPASPEEVCGASAQLNEP